MEDFLSVVPEKGNDSQLWFNEEFPKWPTQCGVAEGFLNPEEKAPLRAALCSKPDDQVLCFPPQTPPHTKDRFQPQEPSRGDALVWSHAESHCSLVTSPRPELEPRVLHHRTETAVGQGRRVGSQHSEPSQRHSCSDCCWTGSESRSRPGADVPLGATAQSDCTSNPTPGRMPRLDCHWKGHTHPYACSTAHNSQDMETNWMTIDRSLGKDVHMYSGKYLAIQNEIMPLAATWIQLEMIILSEVRDGDFPNSPVVNSAPSSVSAGKRKNTISCMCNTTQTHLWNRITHRTDWWLRGRGCWERGAVGGWG